MSLWKRLFGGGKSDESPRGLVPVFGGDSTDSLVAVIPFARVCPWDPLLIMRHIVQSDALCNMGALDIALIGFRDSLTEMQRLAASDPLTVGGQRDVILSMCQERIGDILYAQGDLSGALQAFREYQVGVRRLGASDPSNAIWQKFIADSHFKIALTVRQSKDHAACETESRACYNVLDSMKKSGLNFDSQMAQMYQRVCQILGV